MASAAAERVARVHVALLAGLVAAWALPAAAADSLLVSDYATGRIHKFSSRTGEYEGEFADVAAQGLSGPKTLVVGPDHLLYVKANEGILRYDAITGAYVDRIDTFSSGMHGLAVAADGRVFTDGPTAFTLYVIDPESRQKSFYHTWGGDNTIGAMAVFEQYLYQYSDPSGPNAVHRVDTETNAKVQGFMTGFANGWGGVDITVGGGPGGPCLYYTERANPYITQDGLKRTVLMAGNNTKATLEAFAENGVLRGIATGPDGNVYFAVNRSAGKCVRQYEVKTGLLRDFTTGGSLSEAWGIAFQPDLQPERGIWLMVR